MSGLLSGEIERDRMVIDASLFSRDMSGRYNVLYLLIFRFPPRVALKQCPIDWAFEIKKEETTRNKENRIVV